MNSEKNWERNFKKDNLNKVNTWARTDKNDYAFKNNFYHFKPIDSNTKYDLKEKKMNNFEDNFKYFTENYEKISKTNKILDEKLSKNLSDEIEAEIKFLLKSIKNEFSWKEIENFLYFLREAKEKFGFYIYTKKMLKIFKTIIDLSENNLKKEALECDSNICSRFRNFLYLSKNDKFFAFILNKEFNLTEDFIHEKITLIENKQNEIIQLLVKKKKSKKNKKTRERQQRKFIENNNNGFNHIYDRNNFVEDKMFNDFQNKDNHGNFYK